MGERAFLAGLGGGCSVPIAAYGTIQGDLLTLKGRVSALDGSQQIDVSTSVKVVIQGVFNFPATYEAGVKLAKMALAEGAAAILEIAN
jgi:hydroxymethylbilane synthase